MGTATDPYQHCEGRYRLTRGVLEALADFQNPLSMLTKSTLILRDLDVYRRLNDVAGLSVSMSVGMLDEAVRRVVEPGTPPGHKRLEILGRFADAGIRTGVLVAPILPGLTDDEEHLDEVIAACAAAGVQWATPIVLHVRPSIREHFMPWMERTYPWLYPRYVELYGRRAYAPKAYQQEVSERFARLRLRHGLGSTSRPETRPRPDSRADRQLALAGVAGGRTGHNACVPLRIEDYGLIGDTQTAALVGRDGSIDWLCMPRFDSGAFFAALLGRPAHGRWLVAPKGEARPAGRRYRDSTLILETDFETDEGAVRVIDFMPPRQRDPDVVRIVEGLRGRVEMRMELIVRFDYGSIVPWVRRIDDATSCIAGPDGLCLRTPVETRGEDLSTVADFAVSEGEQVPFVLTWYPSNEPLPREIEPGRALVETQAWWRQWARRVQYEGPWRDEVLALPDRPEGAHLRADGRASWRPRPPRCRSFSGASGTGTTAIAGSETRPSPSTRSWKRASRERPSLARLAPACDRRGSGRPPDHVRSRGGAAPDRVRGDLAPRLPGPEAGSDRKRRVRPEAARRLRRGHGRALPRRGARSRGGVEGLGDPEEAARPLGVGVAGAGQRDLGGARPPPPLHALEGHGLAGRRPGSACRAQPRRRVRGPLAAPAPGNPRARSCGRDSTRN